MGSKSGLIKAELIRLLKDDNEEVLQGLIPHISEILEHLLQNQVIGLDQVVRIINVFLNKCYMNILLKLKLLMIFVGIVYSRFR